VLRVDTAGHKFGGESKEYEDAAKQADGFVGDAVSRAPGARWFLLSDHGHVPQGGHGGEERFLRQVTMCIAGPGIAKRTGGPIHLVDISRAIADSTGVKLPPESMGRPLDAAIAHPLDGDQAVPKLRTTRLLLACLIVGAALFGIAYLARKKRYWLLPLWLPIAIASLVIVRGSPTMSTPMIYPPSGRDMWLTWQPAMALGALAVLWSIWKHHATLREIFLGQLALPVALWAAAITLCGGWPTLFGAELAPLVPFATGWCSPLFLLAGQWGMYLGGAIAIGAALPQRPPVPKV
jgi:hypothetical protein